MHFCFITANEHLSAMLSDVCCNLICLLSILTSKISVAAKKAKFAANYGCEEGKCGSCELKVNGKTKIRPCIGKVPAGPGPVTFTEP